MMPRKSYLGCAAALTVCAALSILAHIPALCYARLVMDFFLWMCMPPVADGLLVCGAIRAVRSPQAAASGKAVQAVLWIDTAVFVLAFAAHLACFFKLTFLDRLS